MLKSRVCDKKDFPYGDNEGVKFYDPSCIKGMYECQDYCGKKCVKNCQLSHNPDCQRGSLPENFLYCPVRTESDHEKYLEYIHYDLVVDSNTKEGEKTLQENGKN